MSDEQNVDAGSETSGDQAADTSAQTDTSSTDTGTDSSKDASADQGAGGAAEPKAGDACKCPDGRPGTLHDQEGTLVCIPNQG